MNRTTSIGGRLLRVAGRKLERSSSAVVIKRNKGRKMKIGTSILQRSLWGVWLDKVALLQSPAWRTGRTLKWYLTCAGRPSQVVCNG